MDFEDSEFLTPGETFGSFVVERLLGKGGMGRVYLMTERSTGRKYAVKVMKPPDGPTRHAWRKRFANEAAFAKKVHHRNLVRVHDIGEDPETQLCYIIMDYMPGGTLADLLKRQGRLGIADATAIAIQVAEGLAAAHDAGIIHRDVKPDNVMFDAGGVVHVVDLGVAKPTASAGAETITQTGMIVGTPAYMAPEQIIDSRRVDVRSDIYSLGILLFEMLTGTRPYAKLSMLEMLAKAIDGEAICDVRQYRKSVPSGLAHAIAKFCAPSLDERVQTAHEAARMLKATLDRPRRAKRLQQALCIGATALIVAGSIATILFSRSSGGIEEGALREAVAGGRTWRYRVENGEAVLSCAESVGGTLACVSGAPAGELEIPASLDGLRVAAIGERAFSGSSGGGVFSRVSIPEGLREIHGCAFIDCSALEEVKLPSSVRKVGARAFAACLSLRRFNAAMCESIDGSAFIDCPQLAEIQVDDANSAFAARDGALYTKDCSKLVAFPKTREAGGLRFARSLERIGASAFASCCFEALRLPAGVAAIEKGAFRNCRRLALLELPDGVRELQDDIFDGCESLVKLVFDGDAPADAAPGVFNGAPETLVIEVGENAKGWGGGQAFSQFWPADGYSDGQSGAHAPAGRRVRRTGEKKDSGDVRAARGGAIPAPVRLEAEGRVWMCREARAGERDRLVLMDVEPAPADGFAIPAAIGGRRIEVVEGALFARCARVTRLSLGEGIAAIHGAAAFGACKELETVELPASMRKLGERAFAGCEKLKEIRVAGGSGAFKSFGGLLYSGDGTRLVACPASRDEITLEKGVAKIEPGAFAGCRCRSISFGEGVCDVGAGAFEDCRLLRRLEFPAVLRSLGERAFKGCTALETIRFNGDAPECGPEVLAGCASTVIVEVMPGSKGWMGAAIHRGDAARIALPDYWPENAGEHSREIRLVGESAENAALRRGTAFLRSGMQRGVREAYDGMSAWFYKPQEAKASGPACSLESPDGAHPCVWPRSVGRIALPVELEGRKVRAIGARAFADCRSLTNVAFPEGLEEIRAPGAFRDCTSLAEIAFPISLKKVEGDAFMGCRTLAKVDIALCASLSGAAFRGCGALAAFAVAPQNAAYEIREGALCAAGGKTVIAFPRTERAARIPADAAVIGEYAASHASFSGRLAVPAGVADIQRGAFEACTALGGVEFFAKTLKLGAAVFAGCENLQYAVFHGDAPVAAADVFAGTPPGLVVYVPRDSRGWTKPGSRRLPARWPAGAGENAREIRFAGESADEARARRLADDAARSDEARIRTFATGRRTWFYSLDEGNAVLGAGGTQPCVSPAPSGRLAIPSEIDGHTVVALGDGAFAGCGNLSVVGLPATLERIGARAFSGCHSLRAVELPPACKSIGERAFAECGKLKKVRLSMCEELAGEAVFAYCPALREFSVARGNPSFTILDGSLYSRDAKCLIAAAVPKDGRFRVRPGVTEIAPYAFCGSGVVDVKLAKSVEKIGENAFKDARSLRRIPQIGE